MPTTCRHFHTADAGGSNSYRNRLWKVELAKLAERTDLAITVGHFPPGTSKWNRVEQRLWSNVTMNWRGRPLTSHEVVVNLIGSTTTRTGLKVRAELDRNSYPLGTKIADNQLAAVVIKPHSFDGQRNYTIAGHQPRLDL